MNDTRPKILIVDDSSVDRAIFRRFLEQDPVHTYAILEAETGEDGFALYQSQRPDCLLLDFNLPDVTGLEVLHRLNAEKGPSPAPVVMVTGQGNEQVAAEAIKSGALDYLTKSNLTATSLRRAIENAIDKLGLQRRLEHENAARERAQQQLQRTAAELVRSNADLEQFAAAVSHDLQEPLRTISSFLGLLVNRYRDALDDTAREWIGFAVDGAERLTRQVHDLLEFSRVSTRGDVLQPTDLTAAFDAAVANLHCRIEETGAVVTHDTLPVVTGDSAQLTHVFQNLIGNALKFRSNSPPAIHVAAKSQDGQWLFSVQDNGIGIDPKYAERIFMIFQRLHTRNEYPGTGIGLSLCKRIVERHGGRIWVESQLGCGATFFFTIPNVSVND